MRRAVVVPFFLLGFFASDLVRTGHSIWLNLPPTGFKCVSEEIQGNVVILADYVVVADNTHAPTISVKEFIPESFIITSVIIKSYNSGDEELWANLPVIITCGPNPSWVIRTEPNSPLNGSLYAPPYGISARLLQVTSPFGNNLHHAENITHGQFALTTSESGNYLACFWLNGTRKQPDTEISVNLDWRVGMAAKDWETLAKKEKIEGVELELRKLEGAVEAIHENLLYLKDREAVMRTVSENTNVRVAWYSIMSVGVCILASTLQIWYLKRFFQKKKLI